MIKKRCFFVLLLLSFVLTMPGLILAFSLKLDTTKIYNKGEPGDIIEGVINVINSQERVLPIVVEVEDLAIDSKKQTTVFKPYNTLENSCARWIRVTPSKVSLTVNGKQALNYMITIPNTELEFAEYYAVIFVTTTSDNKNKDLSQAIVLGAKAKMGVLVKITIGSKAKPSAKIIDCKVFPANEDNSLKIVYNYQNTGNIFQKVYGSFSIIDGDGNLFGRGNLTSGISNPGDTISIESEWDGELDAGTYDMIAEFRYEPEQIEIKEISFESEYQD